MKWMIEHKKLMLYLWLTDDADFFEEDKWNTTVMQPWSLET